MRPVPKARRLSLSGTGKRSVRTQFAALCYRQVATDTPEICLVTSRTSHRWILPKGWPMDRMTPAQAAATEAFEEAGLRGRMFETCIGIYDTRKHHDPIRPFLAMVFPMRIQTVLPKWPERKQRRRKFFTPERAAEKVDEPGLQAILLTFDPASFGA